MSGKAKMGLFFLLCIAAGTFIVAGLHGIGVFLIIFGIASLWGLAITDEDAIN